METSMDNPHASGQTGRAPERATLRRPYAAPRLMVHGTLAALTAGTAADGLVVSRLTGG
jgi:hypothetical protein